MAGSGLFRPPGSRADGCICYAMRLPSLGIFLLLAEDSMALTPARTMPGVLELLPLDQIAFERMLDVFRRNYERFGFLPVETPVASGKK